MTRRTWIGTILIVLLALLGLRLAAGSGETALRSLHGEPAATAAPERVVIVAGGKVYHRPGCTYLHGEGKAASAADAVQQGYTPCVRCLKEILPP